MYIGRKIDNELLEWKNGYNRKPLLLRGARQVGKSSTVRHLGETFKHYAEVNFEKRPELRSLFSQGNDVRETAARLGGVLGVPIVPGSTLLFLDEIQSCPEAIKSLWFFKEDYPELHVVAAGSLLEFALKDTPSFGVGRIRSMFMYPLSFDEFLHAMGKDMWIEAKQQADCNKPLFDQLHNAIVQEFRIFLMVGGMPASVVTWMETHDYVQCALEQQDIQQTYYDDFAKYAPRIDPQLLRNTLQSVVMQVGRKFVYNRVEGGYRTEDVKQALTMLCHAGIIKEVRHTAANGLPLGAETNNKFRKFIYLDSGLMLRIQDLDLGGAQPVVQQILGGTADELVNKGAITEMVAGWELVKAKSSHTNHELFYWQDLGDGTMSEVDYIITHNMKLLPIEVKAGTSGKMKSLRLFMQKKGIKRAIRTSLENFGVITLSKGDADSRIEIVPLYALAQVTTLVQ